MKLIIFDCDGTIADSQHAIVAAMVETFATFQMPSPARADVLGVIGLSLVEAMKRLAPEADSGLVRDLAQRYGIVAAELRERGVNAEPLFPGAREALQALARRGDIILGIATGKSVRGLNLLLEREGLAHLFATIQTADTHPSKPHPAMIEAAMDETGLTTDRVVMVGDTTFDIEMARRAHVGAIAVAWGYHSPAMLLTAGAVAMIDDFSDLESAIDRYFVAREAVA